MEVDQPADDAQPLKRKRSQEIQDGQEPDYIQREHEQSVCSSSSGTPVALNGVKRQKLEDHVRERVVTRVDIPSDKSQLPAELWQYVFGFLAPPTLSRLLAVNHRFKNLLSAEKSQVSDASSLGGYLQSLDSNSIWLASRRLFFPNMPRPLSTHTELEMWRLIRGRHCQFCGRTPAANPPSLANQPWAAGPGANGVRVVWPFGIRTCGTCLALHTKKEMDIMFSSSIPSALLPALPFGFFTSSMDYISPITLRAHSPPPSISMAKYYLQSHLDDIKQKFEEVRALGGATAEEWFKGLEGTGKDRLSDAFRWEQWEFEGQMQKVHCFRESKVVVPTPRREYALETTVESSKHMSLSKVAVPSTQDTGPVAASMVSSSYPAEPSFAVHEPSNPLPSGPPGVATYALAPPPPGFQALPQPPPKAMTPITPLTPTTPIATFHLQQPFRPNAVPMSIQPHAPQTRAERTIKDINEAKAQRKAEIERRCMELNPPIQPSTLVHMDSFAAAMQIPMALTDPAWEVLKPRLLAQREVAEAREREQLQHNQILQARTEERRQQEAQMQAAKENLDRQWEAAQQPLREKLDQYAEEIIHVQWANGATVNKGCCAQFAADVITYVRRRFYQIQEYEDGLTGAPGRPPRTDPVASTTARTLTLENMRWVFENKVKPLTEPHSREIFLCRGCYNSSKFYGFEGVIQHYAAKHTSLLSMGSVVVHWKADWPEDPPFDPNPGGSHRSTSIASVSHYPPQPGPQDIYGPFTIVNASQVHTPHGLTQQSPVGEYPVYTPSYPYSQIQFSPPSVPAAALSGMTHYQPTQPSYASASPQTHSAQHVGSQWSPPSHSSPSSQSFRSGLGQFHPNGPQTGWPIAQQKQHTSRPTFPPHLGAPGQPFGIYQVQLEALSQNAREIFDGTSEVRDFPTSVRIHVIIAHVVLRFKDRFTNEPNLALFTDALNNSSKMKPLRDIGDLACKACALNDHNETLRASVQDEDGTLYSLPTLLTHFQSIHVEQSKPAVTSQNSVEAPRLDWKFDMVKLPPKDEIVKLVDAPGMTDAKLNIVATVLPGVFPSPLPKIGNREPYLEHYQSAAQADTSVHIRPLQSERLEVAVDNFPRFVESPLRETEQSDEPPREDEYDPHRPAYPEPTLGSHVRFDHSKQRTKNGSILGSRVYPSSDARERAYNGQPRDSTMHTKHRTLSAAEDFLNNFDSGGDRDIYEPPEHVTPVAVQQGSYTTPFSPTTSSRPLTSHDAWAKPTSYGSSSNWNRRGIDSDLEVRVRDPTFAPREAHYPGAIEHVRYVHAVPETIVHETPDARRPISHFEERDQPRQTSYGPPSHSPRGPPQQLSDDMYYRTRSPLHETSPFYGTQRVVRETAHVPHGEAVQFRQRGYAEAPYDAPVEYVRIPQRQIHEPQQYYSERSIQTVGSHVEYEGPVFEHNGQLYRRAQAPPDPRQFYR